ncbi:SubName: Full=Related to 2-dehydropantoate 2-reductase {ECO:0000313/EMBL:CCA69811.1} [Serendipita indica DSM 11827]|uniref:2-dehydropantoate 2-reductase n=1 Tax=Serendipita indica (strain DSM 11827) TaxID=1109443 RepID=G4TEQ9_SERID|nr:SubName: Full=Related to 2-dehydropantoate 2-reductase {ECO:0000313/EMBL:CCA69811.1} [Serendipita indica DSM 11827]CCA69811.1 related to 2-dehydropantoate 2-reductase [Serendipita indica DSM 11827]
MRFHVLGIGSIGTLVAHHLRRTLPPTDHLSLIVRKERNGFIPKNAPSSLIVELDGVRSYVRGGFDTEWAESSQEAVSRLVQMLKDEQMRKEVEKVDKLQRLKNSLEMSPLGKHIDVLIVTTKANKTLQAIQQCRERLSRNSTIVLLQNGMGIYETVVDNLFPLAQERPNFILATTTHGAWKKRDVADAHHVVHAGKGELHFGIVPDSFPTRQRDFERSFWNVPSDTPVSERILSLGDIEDAEAASSAVSEVLEGSKYASLRRTVAALLALDLDTKWQPISQLQIRLRQKVSINSSVNPLTALLGCRNGDLLGSTHARSLVRSVCHEAADVFRQQTLAQGGEGTDEWLFGGGQASSGGMQALSPGVLERETYKVIKATSQNYSSMLLDMERGSVLEVDFMNGYISRLGQAYNVPTPTIDALRHAVLIKASFRRVSRVVRL